MVGTGACWLDTAPCRGADYEVCLFLRNLFGSDGSLLVGTTPKCLRYLNCSRLRRERKRLSVRVIPMFIVGGQVQPFSGLSLKKVYAESLRSMYARSRWRVLHGTIDTGTTIVQVFARVEGKIGNNEVVFMRPQQFFLVIVLG